MFVPISTLLWTKEWMDAGYACAAHSIVSCDLIKFKCNVSRCRYFERPLNNGCLFYLLLTQVIFKYTFNKCVGFCSSMEKNPVMHGP